MMRPVKRISVIGLGKLGSPMAAVFAAKGYEVIGTDVDEQKVHDINRGIAPVQETQLQDYINLTTNRLSATRDTCSAVEKTDISFVIVPTPSDSDGGFSLSRVLPVCESIGLGLRNKDRFHVVVITSTVMPGSTDGPIRKTLEEVSGKRCGIDFGLCYSPEFIALGSVIQNYLHPDFVLIGESDTRSGDILEPIYHSVCENNPPVSRMNFVNAELTKISVNSFVTMKITFANMISHICQSLPGADVDTVTSALGNDTRIGKKYLTGATGFGGPCFPRDNRAVARLGQLCNIDTGLSEATDRLNRKEVNHLAKTVLDKLPKNGSVGILGLAYKPDTDVVEEAQGFLLAQHLAKQGHTVNTFDALASENAQNVLAKNNAQGIENIYFFDSVQQCVKQSDVVVIMLPNKEYMSILHVLNGDRRRVIIDCWRILNRHRVEQEAEYIGLGYGSVSSSSRENEMARASTRESYRLD